jgi:hypothetical protein
MRTTLAILAGAFFAAPTAGADISCKNPATFKCEDTSPAHYPDFVTCGDFIGFTKLTDEQKAAKDSFTLPADAAIYPAGYCGDSNPPLALGNCYYDSAPHSVLAGSGVNGLLKEFGMDLSLAATQSLNVSLVVADTSAKGCSKAGMPSADGKSLLGVCAGFITCRGGQSHFKTCRASAADACPTADQCESDSSAEFTATPDKRMDPKSTHSEGNGLFHALGISRKTKTLSSVISEPGSVPLVVRNKDGAGECVAPYKSSPDRGDPSYSIVAAQADKDGCPKNIKGALKDACVNPKNVKIQSYEGKLVYPAYRGGSAQEAQ